MPEYRPRIRNILLVLCYLMSVGLIMIEAVHMGIDSDRANHLLQARDIAGGNLFLSDWNLTKAHFLTTDLIAYLIGYLAGGGLDYTAAVITYTVMYAALLAVTMVAALKGGRLRSFGEDLPGGICLISFVLYLCIPCWNMMGIGRIHVIAYVYCIIAMILASDILKGARSYQRPEQAAEADGKLSGGADKRMGRKIFGLTLLLTVGSFGDFLVFLYGAVPILLYVFIRLLQSGGAARPEEKGSRRFTMHFAAPAAEKGTLRKREPGTDARETERRICRQLGISVFLSLPISVLMDLAYYAIGGANRNGSIFLIRFSDPHVWGERFAALFRAILKFAEGGESENGLLSFDAFLHLCNAILVVISLGILFLVIVRFLRRAKTDAVSVLLSFSALIAAAVFVFTERCEERYLELISTGLLIIFVRNAGSCIRRCKKASGIRVLLIVLIYFAVAGRTNEIVRGVQINAGTASRLEAQGERLARACAGKGCINGYASFWNASVYTVLTHGKVSVRHIMRTYDGETGDIRMQMYCWFNKNEWYAAPADFVLIDDRMEYRGDGDEFGVSEMNCVQVFGEPSERIDLGDQLLLLYDHDISTDLTR